MCNEFIRKLMIDESIQSQSACDIKVVSNSKSLSFFMVLILFANVCNIFPTNTLIGNLLDLSEQHIKPLKHLKYKTS